MTLSNIIFIIQGVGVSLEYTFISLFFGCMIGLMLANGQFSNSKIIKAFTNAYISVFRGTPLLVQLSFVYFAIPSLTGINISGFYAGLVAFSLNSAAYVSEIMRGGIQSIDKGQFDACQTLGINKFYAMKDIIIPQAFRNSLPALTNELVTLLKETSLISTIGGMDIMRRAHLIAAEQYTYLMPLLIAAACYYVLVLSLTAGCKQLEKRFSYDQVPASI